jgi:hypothetical protein
MWTRAQFVGEADLAPVGDVLGNDRDPERERRGM